MIELFYITLAVVCSFLALFFSFAFGAILGVYTVWEEELNSWEEVKEYLNE